MHIPIWLTFVALLAGALCTDDIEINANENRPEWWDLNQNPVCALVTSISATVSMWSGVIWEPFRSCVTGQLAVVQDYVCRKGNLTVSPHCLGLLTGFNEFSATSRPTTISASSSTYSSTSGQTTPSGVRSRHLPAEHKHHAAHKHHLHHSAKSHAQHKDHQV